MSPRPQEQDMDTSEIRRLIEEGVLLTSPVRARSPRDTERVRAALARRAG